MGDRKQAHLTDEAVYDYVDRALGAQAMARAGQHVRTCPACARRIQQAQRLFAGLAKADAPALTRDLAPGVVARLEAARAARLHLRWALAAEAAVATAVLAALGVRLQVWLDALAAGPGYLELRQQGLSLIAEVSTWVAPFFELVPAFPARLTPIRIVVPHLDGSVQGWLGVAAAAVLLGLVGNALLLRSTSGLAGPATDIGSGQQMPGRHISGGTRGGAR